MSAQYNIVRLFDFAGPLKKIVGGEWDLTSRLTTKCMGIRRKIPFLINNLLNKLHDQISKIAKASVSLTRIAPELASMAHTAETDARDQAERSLQIASAAEELSAIVHDVAENIKDVAEFANQVSHNVTNARSFGEEAASHMQTIAKEVETLTQIVETAHMGSKNIEKIIQLIKQVAGQTRLLALNAGIEAARAGEYGRSFGVLAKEIGKLAEETSGAVTEIEESLTTVMVSIDKSVEAANSVNQHVIEGRNVVVSSSEALGFVNNNMITLNERVQHIALTGKEQDSAVKQITQDIQVISKIGQRQLKNASHLNNLAKEVKTCSDKLLEAVGVFRLKTHQRAKEAVAQAARMPDMLSMDRTRQENCMRRIIEQYPFLELLYVTDENGIQVTDNISSLDFQAAYGSNGYGQNWSQRPWFKKAMEKRDIYISDLYRSVASDNYCFTISTPLKGKGGKVIGVLGADVNFTQILEG